MAKLEKIDKWMDSGEEPKSKKNKAKEKKGASLASEINLKARKKITKSPRASSVSQIARIQQLLKESPDSPEFLGKIKISVPESKKGFFKKKKYQDLAKLRNDLNMLTKDGKVDLHSRQKVRTDLKKYPDVPDLHVINAVYTYQDTPRIDDAQAISQQAQDKLNEHQLSQLKRAIHEVVLAFHQGGLSIFNINWFMKIYIDYLNVYKTRLTHMYRGIAKNKDPESITIAKKLRNKQAEIIELQQVKARFGGLSKLGIKLNATTYLSDHFTPMEIKRAAAAFKAGDLSKVIVEERRAGKIIFVYLTVLTLLAKIPILKHLVEHELSTIPEDDRGIALRKRMVTTLMLVSEFELAMNSGDKTSARNAANGMYRYCLETIKNRLQGQVMRELYEVDSLLKAVWIVKAADGLFEKSAYKKLLQQAYGHLKVISSEQNALKDKKREMVVELAGKYTYQLDTIMDQNGWIGEVESQSWSNRDN
ncbi:MAG: hypothetical protein HN580_17985 [Deltaproteobacteria bacterium]|jgi:hypothetical protein|nr:hypothetical protein [Deltaproteobacteria bacterium]MBT4090577.1 hypothetical protein [Deltaproteobacteria bacterium]MBT4263202.1 hypothetical protein [Deltaproteobacteria bacterium]MBT4640950.1 hypothetical protein [Deltaproteobacteria bacterium]MBT6501831.1 hypothetical protein [Deltaproteobacteria bacterium]